MYLDLNTSFALTDMRNLDRDSSPPPPSYKSAEPPEFLTRPTDSSEDDQEEYPQQQQSGHLPRKGGYDARVQQVLYENPDLEIIITDAGKSPHGSFIEYRIKTGVCVTA